jgi:glutaminyl-peptide cyclotransferase
MWIGGLIAPRSNTRRIDLGGEFDAKRAFADLKRLVSFGPTPSGSRALEQSREFIAEELRAAGATVVLDSFTALTPFGPIPMTNLVAKVPGVRPSIVIVAGHYETKGTKFPFVGANDGGSSAAFFLEMARVLARRNNRLAYWLVSSTGKRPCSGGPTQMACTVVGTSFTSFQLKEH